MKTKKEILEEIAAKYTISNRSVDFRGMCFYNHPDGRECAFTMMCDPEKKKELVEDKSCTHQANEPDYYLKDEYKGHGQGFYSRCQSLHDASYYWDENGLSESGRFFIKDTLAKYGLI